jgi:nucleosome binding factor SPN SPT16 subunit
MADIKIDSKVFQDRISHFVNAWKADRRAGDALFGGASSIVINMGKVEANPEFHKNNATHVSHAYCALPTLHVRLLLPSSGF